jgi:two-component system sensor histidine kinase SenX3
VPESTFEAVVEALPLGVVVADPSGSISYMNTVARQLAGEGVRAALASRALRQLLEEVRLERMPVRKDLDLAGPPPQSLSMEARPLAGAGSVGIIRDLTELRQLESVRRDFVANVSHELRTPIGAIAVLAEALGHAPAPEDTERLAQRVRTETDRLKELVSDLLDLSRIEALRPPEGSETVKLHTVVARGADRIRHLAAEREVQIEISTGESLGLPGDETQLVSAVANLIENAVKHSARGQRVEVVTSRRGTDIVVQVRDHGIGIPTRDLDRIFERFYRVDRARSRAELGSGGGTGLGLSIVRHVATNHGGTVEVQSREGEGSTFTLVLPESGP